MGCEVRLVFIRGFYVSWGWNGVRRILFGMGRRGEGVGFVVI